MYDWRRTLTVHEEEPEEQEKEKFQKRNIHQS